MAAPSKIIIDTDPGQDDACAILLALASPENVEILGLTVVAGNVPLSMTSRNARIVCELAGRKDIAIYEGALKPLQRPQVTAEHVHGTTGLDGAELPEPSMLVQKQHAVDFIIETIRREEPGTVTLCTLGPQTNIALALQKAPDIAGRVRELVMMGGGFSEGGNITPAAEFNVYVDPHASDIVFKSGIPIVVLPLDVTHQVMATQSRIARIGALGSHQAATVVKWLGFSERFDIEKYGSDGGPLHDPTVIAYLIKPELFAGRHCNVEVETASELTAGMTVVDWWGVSGRKPNATFMRTVNADGFFELLTERLARY